MLYQHNKDFTMKNKGIFHLKQKKMLFAVLGLLAVSYLVYASNIFFMSETERLMTSKIMAMISDK